MISVNSLVLYKNQPALVQEASGGKFSIVYCTAPASPGGKPPQFATQKVRDKDIVLLVKQTGCLGTHAAENAQTGLLFRHNGLLALACHSERSEESNIENLLLQ